MAAFVQIFGTTTITNPTSGNYNLPITVNGTAGNTIIVVGAFIGAAANEMLPTGDSRSNSYTNLTYTAYGYSTLSYAHETTALQNGDNITLHIGGSVSSTMLWVALEYSGIQASSPVDQHAIQGNSGFTSSTISMTSTVASDIFITYCDASSVSSGSPNLGASSFTIRETYNSGADYLVVADYSPGVVYSGHTETWSWNGSSTYNVGYASFFAVAGIPPLHSAIAPQAVSRAGNY